MSSHFAKSLAACALALATGGARSAEAQFADSPETPPAAAPAAKPAPRLPPGKPNAWTPPADVLIVPGFWSLGMRSVQRDIGLTAEQKAKLTEMSDAYMLAVHRSFDQFQDLPPQEQQQKAAGFHEQVGRLMQATRRKAAAILTPQQAAAVRMIDLQLQATDLANRGSQDQLQLTDDQRERLRRIFDESQEKIKQLEDKMQQVHRETGARALEVLAPAQVEQLRQQLEKRETGGAP
jgi:Spy/CpxP family protein refolding chaperone